MKKSILVFSFLIIAVLLMGASSSFAQAPPSATITLLNPPPGGILELDVGESYTFGIEITSSEPFIIAMAMTDAYYPGRGVFWHGSDRATKTDYALLHLTMTGKNSTADLGPACDWPEPGGGCLPNGVAPVAIAVGVRYKGNLALSEYFTFGVVVP